MSGFCENGSKYLPLLLLCGTKRFTTQEDQLLKGKDQSFLNIRKPLMNTLPVECVHVLSKGFSFLTGKFSGWKNAEWKVARAMLDGPELLDVCVKKTRSNVLLFWTQSIINRFIVVLHCFCLVRVCFLSVQLCILYVVVHLFIVWKINKTVGK